MSHLKSFTAQLVNAEILWHGYDSKRKEFLLALSSKRNWKQGYFTLEIVRLTDQCKILSRNRPVFERDPSQSYMGNTGAPSVTSDGVSPKGTVVLSCYVAGKSRLCAFDRLGNLRWTQVLSATFIDEEEGLIHVSSTAPGFEVMYRAENLNKRPRGNENTAILDMDTGVFLGYVAVERSRVGLGNEPWQPRFECGTWLEFYIQQRILIKNENMATLTEYALDSVSESRDPSKIYRCPGSLCDILVLDDSREVLTRYTLGNQVVFEINDILPDMRLLCDLDENEVITYAIGFDTEYIPMVACLRLDTGEVVYRKHFKCDYTMNTFKQLVTVDETTLFFTGSSCDGAIAGIVRLEKEFQQTPKHDEMQELAECIELAVSINQKVSRMQSIEDQLNRLALTDERSKLVEVLKQTMSLLEHL